MDNGSKKIILPCFKANRKLKSASVKQIFLLILVRSTGKFPKNLETGMDLFLVIFQSLLKYKGLSLKRIFSIAI